MSTSRQWHFGCNGLGGHLSLTKQQPFRFKHFAQCDVTAPIAVFRSFSSLVVAGFVPLCIHCTQCTDNIFIVYSFASRSVSIFPPCRNRLSREFCIFKTLCQLFSTGICSELVSVIVERVCLHTEVERQPGVAGFSAILLWHRCKAHKSQFLRREYKKREAGICSCSLRVKSACLIE